MTKTDLVVLAALLTVTTLWMGLLISLAMNHARKGRPLPRRIEIDEQSGYTADYRAPGRRR